MKFKNIGKYSLYFVGYYLVCENIVMEIFDEKFDGIFDFVDFIQNFHSFFFGLSIVFRCK